MVKRDCWRPAIACVLVLVAGCVKPSPPSRPSAPPPGAIPDFTLLDQRGASHGFYREGDARILVFVSQGNDCPIIQKYAETLRKLNEEFSPKGVRFFLLNANPGDSRDSIVHEAEEYRFGAPILLDPSQVVAKTLGLTRTAEAVVVDTKTWTTRYRGAIDDRFGYGVDKRDAGRRYLADAIESLLAGRSPAADAPAARGCLITFRDHARVSYVRDVAPILRAKCLGCHTPTGQYPPYFSDFERLRAWASMIRETVVTERMPPASYDPYYGKFQGASPLTAEEKARLVAWIDGGMQRDAGRDPLTLDVATKKRKLPPKLWEVAMAAPVRIAPDGTKEYEYFQLGGPAPYDMWVTAFHTVTTNPRQLHHEALMIVPKPLSYYEKSASLLREEHAKSRADGEVPNWILKAMRGFASGDPEAYARQNVFGAGREQPSFLPPGSAFFIPRGHYAVIEVHYLGVGKEDHEQTHIEFFGQRARGALKPIRRLTLVEKDYEIPPEKKSFEVQFRPVTVHEDIEVQSVMFHMHVRGRATRVSVVSPEGKETTLASVPNFDFSWHTGNELVPEHPLRIRAGSKVKAVCEFDNSAFNPANPDPSATIHWGQLFARNEMCMVTLGYTAAP